MKFSDIKQRFLALCATKKLCTDMLSFHYNTTILVQDIFKLPESGTLDSPLLFPILFLCFTLHKETYELSFVILKDPYGRQPANGDHVGCCVMAAQVDAPHSFHIYNTSLGGKTVDLANVFTLFCGRG